MKNKRKEHRFGLLNEIDDKAQSYIIEDNSDISLADFCCKFRDFCADKLNLYYDIKTIRRFVAGLSITHLTILQGMSGTGKTSLAYAFGEFIENESVNAEYAVAYKIPSILSFAHASGNISCFCLRFDLGGRHSVRTGILPQGKRNGAIPAVYPWFGGKRKGANR